VTPADEIRAVLERVKELDREASPAPHLTRYGHGGGRAWTGTPSDPGRTLVADYYNEGDREFYHAARDGWPRLAKAVEILLGRLDERKCSKGIHPVEGQVERANLLADLAAALRGEER